MPDHAEMRDVHGRRIAYLLLALIAGIGFVCWIGHVLLAWWDAPVKGPNAPLDFRIEPPVLESAPLALRARFEAEKRLLLERYGWIEPDDGSAAIPGDVARRVPTPPTPKPARKAGR